MNLKRKTRDLSRVFHNTYRQVIGRILYLNNNLSWSWITPKTHAALRQHFTKKVLATRPCAQ